MLNADLLAFTDEELGSCLLGLASTKARNAGKVARALLLEINTEALAYPGRPYTLQRRVVDALVAFRPSLYGRFRPYFPSAETMVRVVEHRVGPIAPESLTMANTACAEMVESVLKPELAAFVAREFGAAIDGVWAVTLDEMMAFLRGPYEEFSSSTWGGLVSRVGAYNEALIRAALRAAGIGAEMVKTGQGRAADIQIRSRQSIPTTLSVEVKSYGARERLVGGLNGCPSPKIGVGFFSSAKEFNQSRTDTLVGTGALAIYMPASTYAALKPAEQGRTNSVAGPFYRCLDQLGFDITRFIQEGERAFRS